MTRSTIAEAERAGGLESRTAGLSELLDIKAVAGMLGCSRRHVSRMSDAGLMPRPVKLGTLVRWRRAQLLEWLVAGCPTVSAERAEVAHGK